MIDLKQLRENPDRFRKGALDKGIAVEIDLLFQRDREHRHFLTELENARAEQNRLSKEIGPQIGKLMAEFKAATDRAVKESLAEKLNELQENPKLLKSEIQGLEHAVRVVEEEIRRLLLEIPLPPDPDVPVGKGAEDNVQIRAWAPKWFDPAKPFEKNKGFAPKSHLDLARDLNLVDFERGVKMSGTRHYVLTGDGMRLHQACLRFALDFITHEHGFTPMGIPVIVREECMVGTGFFPAGREQAYHIEESRRGGAPGSDLFLTGTGEVALMGFHADEILDAASLPLRYCTVSTCFRREAGAAGKDTAGLYRIHQFDKVEQVVICRADEQESREWHKKMIAIVESLLQKLELPHRLLQCCTGDLGPKNADMIDIETWMPSRGGYGETHSASRLYDFQCRRLNMRYKDAPGAVRTTFCHSLNNTVLASPRILIPILELYQNKDGTIDIPAALRPYMNNRQKIG